MAADRQLRIGKHRSIGVRIIRLGERVILLMEPLSPTPVWTAIRRPAKRWISKGEIASASTFLEAHMKETTTTGCWPEPTGSGRPTQTRSSPFGSRVIASARRRCFSVRTRRTSGRLPYQKVCSGVTTPAAQDAPRRDPTTNSSSQRDPYRRRSNPSAEYVTYTSGTYTGLCAKNASTSPTRNVLPPEQGAWHEGCRRESLARHRRPPTAARPGHRRSRLPQRELSKRRRQTSPLLRPTSPPECQAPALLVRGREGAKCIRRKTEMTCRIVENGKPQDCRRQDSNVEDEQHLSKVSIPNI